MVIAMPTGKITKSAVDAVKPGRGDVFLWDAGDSSTKGFGLKVTPTGGRVYIYQYRLGGRGAKTRRYTIGKHGQFTAETARKEAERLGRLVSAGIDPLEDKQRLQREAVDLAFNSYGARFLEDYVRSEWKASYTFAESILRLHVFPALGSKPLTKVTRADLTSLLDRIPAKKGALRRNVYAVVRRLFRWAVGRGDIERSPLEGFEAPAVAASRDRVLSDEELALAWEAAEDLGYPFGPMFQLLIVTGQRREEVAALDWSELHRDSATWTLPSDRAKNSMTHVVPLSASAVTILDGLARRRDPNAEKLKWPRRGLVFTTTGKTAVSGHSRAKDRLDTAMVKLRQKQAVERGEGLLEASNIKPWRVHDLRRTLATGLQRLGVRFEVTEAVLNHVSGARSGVAGVYQRHDWKDEKRAALDAWGSWLERLIAGAGQGSNVVALKRA